MQRHWRSALTAGRRTSLSVALLGSILLLTGCGSASLVNVSSSADIRSYQDLSDRLDREVNGNGRQREAADYLAWARLNLPVKSCMAAKNLPYKARFTSGNQGYKAHGPTASTWLKELHLRIVSERARGSVESARIQEANMQPLEPAAIEAGKTYRETLEGCRKNAKNPEDVAFPAGLEKLRSSLNSVVFAVEEKVGQPEEYANCMKDQGIDLTGRFDVSGFDATYMYLTSLLPDPSEIPAQDEQPSRAWKEFLQKEGEVLDADAACRQSIYEEGMTILGPQLEQFQADHREELEEVQTGWNAIVDRATAKGWHPL